MYKPPPGQRAKCKRCKYFWVRNGHDYEGGCCQYIMLTGHSRGGDPCDKYEPLDKNNRISTAMRFK